LANSLKPGQRLVPGQELPINAAKIVPKTLDNGVVIDVSARMLYFFKNGMIELSFPVGLGMPEWRGISYPDLWDLCQYRFAHQEHLFLNRFRNEPHRVSCLSRYGKSPDGSMPP
jgi:hypothetical protein